MVAGRRLRGEYEQRSAQHQARRGGDLGVEAVVEDGACAGEAGGWPAVVETGRQVDEEDDGETERSQREDDAAKLTATAVAHHCQRQRRREQRHGQQHV